MKKEIINLLLIFLLTTACIQSQSLKLGFRIEPSFLSIEKNNSSSIGFSAYSIYLSTLIKPIDNFSIEFRPGYFIGDEDYMGYELGGYLRYCFYSNFYLIAGLNNHYNRGGSAHNGGDAYQKDILYKCIGVGYQKDSKFGLDISYYWTNNKEFGYTYDTMHSILTPKKMNGILKFSFSLAWDIF